MLDWQIDLGADEAIGDAPLNRYETAEDMAKLAAAKPLAAQKAEPPPAARPPSDAEQSAKAITAATRLAGAARNLSELQEALAAYEFCTLKKGARNLVFADGNPAGRVMIIGEAPGRDEDLAGKPFVGRAGQLLDKMLAAIDLARGTEAAAQAVYITNVLPWRPPQNRDPKPEEIAMLLPFLKRHIELAQPDVLILMGNIACQALLGSSGITRLRGTWAKVMGLPAMPMFHPAYLLRTPARKRESWADLLEVNARLKEKTDVAN